MSDTYNVIITGKLIDGFDLESVQNSLSELFKISQEKVKLYLNGDPKILKKEADQKTASQYKTKIERLGASVELRKTSLVSKPQTKQATTKAKKKQAKTAEVAAKKSEKKAIINQSIIDKMRQQGSDINPIEFGRVKHQHKMETVEIIKEPINWLLSLSGVTGIVVGCADLSLYYLNMPTLTNAFWMPVVLLIVGAVMVKSSIEN